MGDNKVVIEDVEVVRGEGYFDPTARAAIEKLLTRWLVRAYIRQYGNGEDETDVQEPVSTGFGPEFREVLR